MDKVIAGKFDAEREWTDQDVAYQLGLKLCNVPKHFL